MDRRKALRNMGMSLGYVVATPTLISIVQSCKTENVLEWTPHFFTKEQGSVLTHLVDIILPKTDTPSATEVQVNIFVDRFANEVMEKEQQDMVKMTMDKFISKALEASGKEKAVDLEPVDLEPIVANALKISKEQEKTYQKAIEAYIEESAAGGGGNLSDDTARYAFTSNLRGLTIWAYKTSEYVGEEILAYQSIPGKYIACGDVEELTEGKAWSL